MFFVDVLILGGSTYVGRRDLKFCWLNLFTDSYLLDRTAASHQKYTRGSHSAFLTIPPLNFTGEESKSAKFGLDFRHRSSFWVALIMKRSNLSVPKYRAGCSDGRSMFTPKIWCSLITS